ncbi:MAG: response regulator [Polaromonas sp.]|uniref:response regulator n=1 Tax=Polaromonas sp. TaxID=1869339 RepID=UPI0025F1C876|nr:response regulator [Polaromonas sp.]MBI2725558.1 response regulator [Polaromonas sp.]
MNEATVSPIRVLVVDDHTLFRRGLTALLSRDPRVQVVGDAGDAGEAQRRAPELQPDVILLDNHLPGVRGVDALAALQDAVPRARIVMLTVSEDETDLAAALRGGAAGYLLKTIEGDALISALERAVRGESVIATEMTGKMVSAYLGAATHSGAVAAPAQTSPLSALSSREREILRGIAQGASNKEIGRELGIAETTVKVHVQNVLRKLHVSTRVHAAVIATEIGLS